MKAARNGRINVFIKLDRRTNFRAEMFLQRQMELCNKIRQLQNVQRIYVWRYTPWGAASPCRKLVDREMGETSEETLGHGLWSTVVTGTGGLGPSA